MSVLRGQVNWSEEDILMLLESIENNLPPNDKRKFKTTQSQMNWEMVAFRGFSAEMCKDKWLEISYHLRKFRTLKELVLEAREHVKKLSKSKHFKKHPDFPKKPLTAYFRFFKEKCRQYSQMYPELSNQELSKVLAKKYKELPQSMKLKYIQDFQKEKQEFQEKLAQFQKDHPGFSQIYKKSVVHKKHQIQTRKVSQGNMNQMGPSLETGDFSKELKFRGMPPKPPMTGYHKFHQDMWSSRELQHLPMRQRMVEIGRCWHRIPQSLKDEYGNVAEQLQKQYKVDLDLWLRSLSPEEYAAYRETSYAKGKNMNKLRQVSFQSMSVNAMQQGLGQEQKLQVPGTNSQGAIQINHHPALGSKCEEEDGEVDENRDSSASRSDDDDRDEESEDLDSTSSFSEDSDSSSSSTQDSDSN